MNLTERDSEMFKSLHGSGTGKQLVDYIDRLISELSSLETLNEENFKSRREAVSIIKKELKARIELVNDPKSTNNNQYS